MTKGAKAGLAVLVVGAIALAAVYILLRPAPSPTVAVDIPAKADTSVSAKNAHIAALVKDYEDGRALEPKATYAERQRRRLAATQALQREDPGALRTAIADEAHADADDARRQVDRMMAEEAARQH